MNQLQTFNFSDKSVRVVLKDGEPWWVAKDVCDILELDQVSRAVERLDTDERRLIQIPHPQAPESSLNVNGINESGLYNLILSSRKPEAKTFRKWVTSEVLPQIRKTGAYTAIPEPTPFFLAQFLLAGYEYYRIPARSQSQVSKLFHIQHNKGD